MFSHVGKYYRFSKEKKTSVMTQQFGLSLQSKSNLKKMDAYRHNNGYMIFETQWAGAGVTHCIAGLTE